MTLSIVQVVLIFIYSSIAGMGSVLDSFQTHRPLIACTMVGLICGNITTGIILGGTLELIAIGWMNIGAAQSPDSALASCIATILVVVGHQSIQEGIAIALPVAVAGQVLTVIVRSITVAWQHAADRVAEDARFGALIALHFSALVVQAMRVAIPTTIVAATVNANAVKAMLNAIPPVVTKGLAVAGGFIVVVGFAMLLNMMWVRYLAPFFFVGFVLSGYLTTFSLLAWGAIGLVIALIYVQLNPNFHKGSVDSSAEAGGSYPLADDELED